jgi:hypothetical protein
VSFPSRCVTHPAFNSAGRVVEPSSAPGGGEQASRLGWGSGLARTVRDASSPRGSQQSAETGVRARPENEKQARETASNQMDLAGLLSCG